MLATRILKQMVFHEPASYAIQGTARPESVAFFNLYYLSKIELNICTFATEAGKVMALPIRVSISFCFLAISTATPFPALAQDCALCAKKVVVVPVTAPCLRDDLERQRNNSSNFITFDLSKCSAAVSNRGVVPGLYTAEDPSARPTIRFVIPKTKIACLRDRFAAAQGNLDPYAVIDVSACP